MAERWLYRGKIEHTAKSVERLYTTAYNCYSKGRMLTRLGIGVVLVIVSLTVSMPMSARAVLMLVGAWLMASRDFPGQIQADRAVEARHGSLPGMDYEFYPDRVRLSGEPQPAEDFMKFVEGKTGLSWRREKSLLSLNLWDLRQLWRDIRGKK